MFLSRANPFLSAALLAAALAACAGDHSPTGPSRSPRDSTEAPRLAPAPSASLTAPVTRRFPFTFRHGRAAGAIAIALTAMCKTSDVSTYVYELTLPSNSLALQFARSATIFLMTEQRHFHRGVTFVREDVSFETELGTLHTTGSVRRLVEPGSTVIAQPYTYTLDQRTLDLYRTGGLLLRVRVTAFVEASVEDYCMREIAGSQAKSRVWVTPYLEVVH